jgi:hypothetical protein
VIARDPSAGPPVGVEPTCRADARHDAIDPQRPHLCIAATQGKGDEGAFWRPPRGERHGREGRNDGTRDRGRPATDGENLPTSPHRTYDPYGSTGAAA